MDHVTGKCEGPICRSVISMCNHMERRDSIPDHLNPNTGKNMYALETTSTLWFQKDEIMIYYRNSSYNNSLSCCFKTVWVSFFHWMQTKRLFDERVTLFYAVTKKETKAYSFQKMKQKNHKHIIKLVNLTHALYSKSFNDKK